MALAIVVVGLRLDRGALFAVPVLFVLVVPFEKLFPRHRQRIRRPQVLTDISYALAGPALNVVALTAGAIVGIISLAWLPGLAVRPLVAQVPSSILPFVGIALFDLAIYWTHRWYHEVPFLWRFHSIHHSPDHMDWISGFRNHPLDGTLIAPAFVFLVTAGFDPEFTGILAIVQFVLGIFLHANVRWRLRPLHRLIITPEFHHWHHANQPGAIHSNYSVFFPMWDQVFGTYFMPSTRRPERYGVSEPIPVGLVAQLRHPFRGMTNPARALRHPIRSIRIAFRFGWSLAVAMKRSALRPRNRPADEYPASAEVPWAMNWPKPAVPAGESAAVEGGRPATPARPSR